ncbi:MAG: lipoyl(octanoyl) transferase LipB [Acinetobacter sp.]
MNDANLAEKPILLVRQFSQLQHYSDTFERMKAYTNQRDESSLDELWILQHHDVLTQGQTGKPEHILIPTNLPVVQSDRGGQVTWHGQGQMILYFLFDLNRLKWHVRTLVSFAEHLMIDLLKKYGIHAYAKPDAPGVYVDGRKIGSLGFKIRRGRSYHGLALNINCDLHGFQTINPCGYAGLEMVRIHDLVKNPPDFAQLSQDVIEYFSQTDYFKNIDVTTDHSNSEVV